MEGVHVKVAIIYHSPCMDGAAAAWAMAQHAAGHEVTFYPAQPRTFPETPGYDVAVFVDMCPPVGSMTPDVWVFDHHKTAEEQLRGKAQGVYSKDFSGAGMAWLYGHQVFGTKPFEGELPEVIQFIQDRDLWTWKLPDSKAVNAAIYTSNPTPEYISLIHNTWSWKQLSDKGRPVVEFEAELVSMVTQRAYPVTVRGVPMMVVNCPILQSEIGNAIVIKHQLPCLVWRTAKPGKVECSLRSMDHLPDVSGIAASFGGGGHRNAAGFSLTDISDVDITRPSLQTPEQGT